MLHTCDTFTAGYYRDFLKPCENSSLYGAKYEKKKRRSKETLPTIITVITTEENLVSGTDKKLFFFFEKKMSKSEAGRGR